VHSRLAEPMRYDAATDKYVPITWEDAFELAGAALRGLASPDEAAFYTSTVSLQNGVTCMVKQAPVGANLVIQVYAGTTLLFTVTIAAGSTTGSATDRCSSSAQSPLSLPCTSSAQLRPTH